MTFTLLTEGVESWLTLTLLDHSRGGTLTLTMMKPGLSPREVTTVHTGRRNDLQLPTLKFSSWLLMTSQNSSDEIPPPHPPPIPSNSPLTSINTYRLISNLDQRSGIKVRIQREKWGEKKSVEIEILIDLQFRHLWKHKWSFIGTQYLILIHSFCLATLHFTDMSATVTSNCVRMIHNENIYILLTK